MNSHTKSNQPSEAERSFLHDLSTPLMIAQGWIERWEAREPEIGNCEEFVKLRLQLEKLGHLLKTRRDQLATSSSPDSKS